jgi:polyhydroxyalkanoate synthase
MKTMKAPPTRAPAHGPDPLDVPLKAAIARLANGISPASLAMAQTDWLLHLATSPSKQHDLAESAVQKAIAFGSYLACSCQGDLEVRPCVQPGPDDKRFTRPEWRAQPFGAMAQAFLLWQQWWEEATHEVRGVSRHHEDIVSFVARQWLDMCSPSNFVPFNPQVLKETGGTGGLNLAQGLANWWRDALAVGAGGKPRGVEAFVPGRTVALTPGKVVMRNELAELIQYEPATARVLKEPVLVVPSWIMKFYILDLTPEDSLVKYLTAQGHTVFMVSWRNPGARDAKLGMEDYLQMGVLDPIEAVRRLCPRTRLHAAGYCLGGTLMAIAAAVLAARRDHCLKTVTLIAGQVDFQEPGELGLFMDESQIAFLEDLMAERGYLDGRQMAGAFQLINSKDLVWSKLVHEYLMGGHSPLTPLRAWNADATRMPARMHSEYLRRLYLHNDLAEGRYRAGGHVINLDQVEAPMFVVATERDHVSPWHSVYKVLRLVRSPTALALTSGGHNVGVVNPPGGPAANPKASYRYAEQGVREAPADPQAWLAHARQYPGSWWPRWHDWLQSHSSGRIAARRVRGLAGAAAADAPGSYVFQE